MNIVDSSGWLEYLSDGPNAAVFLPPMKDSASLVVPVVTIYEMFKIALRDKGEAAALEAAMAMRWGLWPTSPLNLP